LELVEQPGGAQAPPATHDREHTHMKTLLSDIFDALAAAAFIAGVVCLAIALNP
jgi:hypothetical protein